LAAFADSFLGVKDVPGAVEFDCRGDERKERQARQSQTKSHANVQNSFRFFINSFFAFKKVFQKPDFADQRKRNFSDDAFVKLFKSHDFYFQG